MRYTWDIVVRMRPTLFVAALAFLVLSQPQQMLELYLIDIENVLSRQIEFGQEDATSFLAFALAGRPVLIAMLCGAGAILVLWLGSVHLLTLRVAEQGGGQSRLYAWLGSVLVLIVVCAPLAGMLLGLENARAELDRIVSGGDASRLSNAVANYRWLTLGLLACAVMVVAIGQTVASGRVARLAEIVFSWPGFVFGASAIVLFSLAIARTPTALPEALGTQALVFIFIGALALVLTCFSRAYRLAGIPVTVLVLSAAVLFSTMGWNDNHKVEHTLGSRPSGTAQGFINWIASRADKAFYEQKGKPYPVYFVAAEGGGIYAGYHVASFLARMQATCPQFAQHVFGISSVSGGSLGAAVFAAHVNRGDGEASNEARQATCSPEVAEEGEIVEGISEFFRNDFLAPLVAATLFPDTLQRLIPFPIKAFDRARGLEQAFVDARAKFWTANGGPNPFEQSINALWNPAGATPALFLNTTSIEMGARVWLGPLADNSPTALNIAALVCQGVRSIDITLAEAVSLSARFPILTPAGWLQIGPSDEKDCGPAPRTRSGARRDRLYLVDGGYFENSGLETAVEMATRLRAINRECQAKPTGSVKVRSTYCDALPKHGFDLRIVMVFAKDDYASQFWGDFADFSATTPGEFAAPIRTMLNTRRARTRAVHTRESLFDENYFYQPTAGRYPIEGEHFLGHDDMHHVMLDGTKSFLPLGWRLSHRSMVNIAESRTRPTAITFELIRRELMGEETLSIRHPPGSATR